MISFQKRHIGPSEDELKEMLEVVNVDNLDQLISETIPSDIIRKDEMDIPSALSEYEYLRMVKEIAAKNKIYKTYIGQGYYGTITP